MRTVISILLLLASVIGFVVVIRPQYAGIQEITAQREELRVALENAEKLRSERETLLGEFKAFDAGDLADLEILLPDNIDNVKLILELDSLAKQLGMSLQDVSVVEEETPGSDVLIRESQTYDVVDLEFSVSGTYGQFVSFIESIENSLRLIDIYEITFQTPSEKGELDYEYNVKIRTYWLK